MDATIQTADMGRTTIQVSDELADELHERKERGESYEDVVWRVIDRADRSGEERDEPGAQGNERRSGGELEPEPAPSREVGERGPEAALSAVEFPGSRDREECIEAVLAAHEYLIREVSASMRDFVQDVMPDHPVGYDVPDLEPGDRYRGSWWRKIVKPGLEALNDVEKPGRGGSEWEYVGGVDE